MVYRVVSTKLTEEEHTKLLDACNRESCTPSSLIKDAIIKQIKEKESSNELTNTKLKEVLRKILKEK